MSRDFSCLENILQKLKQMPSEDPMSFVSRLFTQFKIAFEYEQLTNVEKTTQSKFIETMCMSSFLRSLTGNIGNVLRASNPTDISSPINMIRREMQHTQFKQQKFSNPNTFQSNKVVL